MAGIRRLVRWAILVCAISSTTAFAQQARSYRCIIEGSKQDIRFQGSDWYVRSNGKGAWKSIGCGAGPGSGAGKPKTECSRDGSTHRAVTTTAYDDGSGSVRRETVDTSRLAYASESGNSAPLRGQCAVLASDDDRPEEAWSLSRKISAGLPFLLVSDRESLDLRPGDWEYAKGRWVVLEGKYHPYSGTWAMNGVGFNPGKTNSYHSCPPYHLTPKNLPACGGVHQAGYTMDRWYKPEERSLVAFGRVYTFDETGAVFAEGKLIGRLVVPNL